jgi:hypothetical protein
MAELGVMPCSTVLNMSEGFSKTLEFEAFSVFQRDIVPSEKEHHK